MKTIRSAMLAAGAVGILCAFALPIHADEESPTVSAILEKHARTAQLTPALEEVVKLTKAGVAESVTLAYVQSSPTAYSLDAQDVVKLQQQGVSAPVITAMMQRGDELRRAQADTKKATQPTAVVQASPHPAPVTYSSTPIYPASTVSVTYFGSRPYDPSCYPGYYGYGRYYAPAYYSYTPRYYGHGYYGSRASYGPGFVGVWGGYRGGFYGGYGICR